MHSGMERQEGDEEEKRERNEGEGIQRGLP